MPRREFRCLSLGAGVQSTTLLLMSARGELPRLDAALFADTGYEPPAVYDHLRWLERESTAAEIPLFRVGRATLRADALTVQQHGHQRGKRWGSLPYFVKQPDGTPGMIRRQCTKEYKLEPIRKQMRALVGLTPGEAAGDKVHVEQWLGISTDELHRIRVSRDYWITLRYPLVFDRTPPMTRQDCLRWLARQYPDHPVPRSACISCPFHTNAEWRRMRDEDPASWAEAVAFDAAIRRPAGLRGEAFLHADRVPLDQADLREDDPRQGQLFTCGVCAT